MGTGASGSSQVKRLGLIGGSGAQALVPAGHEVLPPRVTPFGPAESPLRRWHTAAGLEILYLDRHGPAGLVPPHLVNYRANLWLLAQEAPDGIIGLNAVGGISEAAWPGRTVVPDQLVDYTWGRAHSYAGEPGFGRLHVDFTTPFDAGLRSLILQAAAAVRLDSLDHGTYGATQGPRLETAAEIDRMAGEGCSIVGMTGMPEAGLARELEQRYAILALVVNRAAGRGLADIHAEIEHHLAQAVAGAARLIDALQAG